MWWCPACLISISELIGFSHASIYFAMLHLIWGLGEKDENRVPFGIY